MASKKTKEEIRKEVLEEDDKKDVHFTTGIIIAVLSGFSSLAGVIAVLSVGFLETFRKDVQAFWMACIPFCFPFLTGVALAYRKQVASVGLHIFLLIATLLAGGAGYGYSIEPVYINRNNCTMVSSERGRCDKETLVILYMAAGGVATGFCILGLLVSMCTFSNAAKRRNKRAHDREVRLQQEIDRKNREVKHIQMQGGNVTYHEKQNAAPKPEAKTPNSVVENGPKSVAVTTNSATTQTPDHDVEKGVATTTKVENGSAGNQDNKDANAGNGPITGSNSSELANGKPPVEAEGDTMTHL